MSSQATISTIHAILPSKQYTFPNKVIELKIWFSGRNCADLKLTKAIFTKQHIYTERRHHHVLTGNE